MSDVAQQVPLLETLKNMPRDGRDCYEVNPTHHRFIPYGIICHEAAREIERLRRAVEVARRKLIFAEVVLTSEEWSLLENNKP